MNKGTLDEFLGKEVSIKGQKEVAEISQELPKGWRWVKLGNHSFFHIETGSTPRTDIKEYWDGNIKWVTPKDLGRVAGKFIFDTERKITRKGLESCSTKIVPKGSIIISTRAPIGHISIAGDDMCFNQGCKAVIIKKPNEILNDFVYYALLTKVKEMIALGSGATFKEISRKKLCTISIPIPFSNGKPDIKEQKRIVARIEEILSRVEEAKKLKTEARKDAEAIMQAALHEVFSKAEEKGWRWDRLENICEKITDGTHGSPKHVTYGVPLLSAKNINDSQLVFENCNYTTEEELKIFEKRIGCKKGDVLLTIVGTIGKTAVVEKDLKVVFLRSVCILRPRKNIVNSYFLHYMLRSKICQDQMVYEKKQVAQPGIYLKEVKGLKIPIPPLEEQEEIVFYLNSLQEKILALRKMQEETEKLLENITLVVLDRAFKGKL